MSGFAAAVGTKARSAVAAAAAHHEMRTISAAIEKLVMPTGACGS